MYRNIMVHNPYMIRSGKGVASSSGSGLHQMFFFFVKLPSFENQSEIAQRCQYFWSSPISLQIHLKIPRVETEMHHLRRWCMRASEHAKN